LAEALYMQLFGVVDEKQFVLIYPDGTLNEENRRFWNATPACCDPSDSVDDVGYLSGLIEEAKQTYNIDPKRVYLVGHSNGGFMSFRMACEASELITAIVSLAGSTFDEPADCAPATIPVSVLAVHGTADATIPYDGRAGFYPGAVETTERFAAAGGCDVGSPTADGTADLVPTLDGAETDKVAYSTGCDDGIDAALWTINEGSHIPIFSPEFADMTTDWLFAHSR
jgi:polyhydroxybutyrate depolymerase